MMPRPELLAVTRRWVPPPGLSRSRPREVHFTAAGWFHAAVSLAFVVGGFVAAIVLFVIATRTQAERQRLLERGVNTTAAVTRLWRSGDEDRSYWVSFRFEANDRQVDGRTRVGGATWSRLRTGTPIAVRYDSSDPENYTAFARDPQALEFWPAFVAGPMVSACGLLLAFPLVRQRRLLVEGRPAPGVVTTRRVKKGRHGSSEQIDYEFLLLNGAAHHGRTTGRKLQQGQTISVIYERDNPAHSAPYPLSLVKTPS